MRVTFADLNIAVIAPIIALVSCLILYLAYKLFYRPDFGTPVRRRLLIRGLRVRRDQLAEVPLWWSNLQVQRAMRGHWKETLRRNVLPPRA
jgi:hypothetical protein